VFLLDVSNLRLEVRQSMPFDALLGFGKQPNAKNISKTAFLVTQRSGVLEGKETTSMGNVSQLSQQI